MRWVRIAFPPAKVLAAALADGAAELARRNRKAAIEHFRLCSEQIHHGNLCWEMGNAFFRRMEADEYWPSWTEH